MHVLGPVTRLFPFDTSHMRQAAKGQAVPSNSCRDPLQLALLLHGLSVTLNPKPTTSLGSSYARVRNTLRTAERGFCKNSK